VNELSHVNNACGHVKDTRYLRKYFDGLFLQRVKLSTVLEGIDNREEMAILITVLRDYVTDEEILNTFRSSFNRRNDVINIFVGIGIPVQTILVWADSKGIKRVREFLKENV
jgi:hypothetical protein